MIGLLLRSRGHLGGAGKIWNFSPVWLRSFSGHRRTVRREPSSSYRSEDSVVALKYDPTLKEGDFTSFGVFPFFQKKLNDLLLPEIQKKKTIPDYNEAPTEDQKRMLAVLNSGHSLLLKGGFQTGKTLALLTYAVSLSLSSTPDFDYLEKKGAIHTVIVVPTDELVQKYYHFTQKLLEGISPDCCPDELIPEISNNRDRTYTLTRRPLVIDFLGKEEQSYSTGHLKADEKPHILITTPSRLESLLKGEDERLGESDLFNLKFFAVDEIDVFLKASRIDDWPVVVQEGKKKKYINKIEKFVQILKEKSVDSYTSMLIRQLKSVERKHFENDRSIQPFKYHELVMGTKIEKVDEYLSENFSEQVVKPDAALLKKLVRIQRKRLYKPLQYCFIGHEEHHYKEMMNTRSSSKAAKEYVSKIKEIEQSEYDSLNELQKQYWNEKLNEKGRDTLTRFVEKTIRFTNSQRRWREQEKQLVNIGNFKIPTNYCLDDKGARKGDDSENVNAYFWSISNDGKVSAIDVTSNYDRAMTSTEMMNKHLGSTDGNVKNFEKSYLKSKLKNLTEYDMTAIYAQSINSSLLESKNTLTSDSPFLIVVPDSPIKLLESLNSSSSSLKFATIETSSSSSIDGHFIARASDIPVEHLIVTPSQLLGQHLSGLSNVLLVGIESLLPELAFNGNSMESENVAGVLEPFADLAYFYLSRLLVSPSGKSKNIIFTITESSTPEDLERLSQIICYNDLLDHLSVKSDDSKLPLQALVYSKQAILKEKFKAPIKAHKVTKVRKRKKVRTNKESTL